MPTIRDDAAACLSFGGEDASLHKIAIHSSPSKMMAVLNSFLAEDTSNEMDHETKQNENSGHETEEERLRREEEESLELARMLMAEEAVASYHFSVELLRESRDQLSQEDYDALEAALREEEEQEAAEQAGYEEDDQGNLSYEIMLALGERIGDVKAERWTMQARKYIDQLPVEKFSSNKTLSEDADDSEYKCLICQHEYACDDDDDLRRLPCGHLFHLECVDLWLSRTDLCPYCRTSICKKKHENKGASSK